MTWTGTGRSALVALLVWGTGAWIVPAQSRTREPDEVSIADEGAYKRELHRCVGDWIEARQLVIVVDKECQGSGKYNKIITGRRGGMTSRKVTHGLCHGSGLVFREKFLKQLLEAYLPSANGPLVAMSGGRPTAAEVESILARGFSLEKVRNVLVHRLGWIRGRGSFKSHQTRIYEPQPGLILATIETNVEPWTTRWVRRGKRWYVINEAEVPSFGPEPVESRRVESPREVPASERSKSAPVALPAWMPLKPERPGSLTIGDTSESLTWELSRRPSGQTRLWITVRKAKIDYCIEKDVVEAAETIEVGGKRIPASDPKNPPPDLGDPLVLSVVRRDDEVVGFSAKLEIDGKEARLVLDIPR